VADTNIANHWRLWLKIEKREPKVKGRKFAMQKHFPRKGTADFAGCAQGHFLPLVGEYRHTGISRQGTEYTKPQTSQPQTLCYNLTDITITTPPLTRILNRLIEEVLSFVATSSESSRPSCYKSSNSILVL
jgi:hypothetical protein